MVAAVAEVAACTGSQSASEEEEAPAPAAGTGLGTPCQEALAARAVYHLSSPTHKHAPRALASATVYSTA